MGIIVACLLLIALAGLGLCAGTAALLYYKFKQLPDKRWKDRVTAELKQMQRLAASLGDRVEAMARDYERECKSLAVEQFDRVLSRIGVSELETFPGIGPQTIARLRDAGFQNLKRMRGAHIAIHGIGDKRQTDINHAVSTLVAQAKQTFAKGDCPEAKSLAKTLSDRRQEIDREKHSIAIKQQVADQVIDQLVRLSDHANKVTFLAFLAGQRQQLVPDSIITSPLPSYDAYLKAQGQRALWAIWAVWRPADGFIYRTL